MYVFLTVSTLNNQLKLDLDSYYEVPNLNLVSFPRISYRCRPAGANIIEYACEKDGTTQTSIFQFRSSFVGFLYKSTCLFRRLSMLILDNTLATIVVPYTKLRALTPLCQVLLPIDYKYTVGPCLIHV